MDHNAMHATLEAPFAEGMNGLTRGRAAAVIGTRVDTDQRQPLGLSWEVCADGEREPVRYGLCLARPQEDFRVRVPVLGLEPDRDYSFRFQLDARASVSGRFRTSRALPQSSHPDIAA